MGKVLEKIGVKPIMFLIDKTRNQRYVNAPLSMHVNPPLSPLRFSDLKYRKLIQGWMRL